MRKNCFSKKQIRHEFFLNVGNSIKREDKHEILKQNNY